MTSPSPRSDRQQMFLSVVRELFIVSLLSYVLFAFIDSRLPGLISDYIPFPLVLAVVLVSGAITFLVGADGHDVDNTTSSPAQSIRSDRPRL